MIKNKKNLLRLVLAVFLSLSILLSACDFINSNQNNVDYVSLINNISTQKISANLTVIQRSSSFGFPSDTNFSESQGSGIIFQKDADGNYYVLTNNHVVTKSAGFGFQSFTVKDYKSNVYAATLIAKNAEYDLALLSFSTDNELSVLPLAEKNPVLDTIAVSISQPQGQNNTITLGKILSYTTIKIEDIATRFSDVKFEVICHDAPTDRGSSGGALLNTDAEIIGVIFACSSDQNNNFVNGFAIPVEKIREFLTSISS